MKQELIKYLCAGLLAVGTDYVSYMLLLQVLSHSPAKAISYVCGMAVAFFVNRLWTFKSTNKAHHDAVKFTIVYMSSFVLNVVTNKIALLVLPSFITFCFLVATGVSVVTNYLGQKFWVYKK
jgi:putative flippase GtrA